MAGPTYQLRDLARVREILSVLVRHGFGQLIQSLPLARLPGLSRLASDLEAQETLPASKRLVAACEELGPTFVKLGQMLSTRPDLLPAEFVSEFETLQDSVSPFPGAEARQRVEEALGAEIDVLFAAFDEEPVASASIAQVHRARLHDGRDVAVKVQRPGIEKTLRSDINILYLLGELVEGQIELGLSTPTGVVEAFDRAISKEIDFENEASNGDVLAEALAGVEGVHVPRVLRRWTSRTVLTMDWVEGNKLSDIESTQADRAVVLDRLAEATFQQIFMHGVFHADPHPGNLIVRDDDTLTFLDFGLMGRITPDMRDTLEALFVGVVFRDPDTVARTLYRAGTSHGRVNLRSLSADVEELLNRYGDTRLDEQDTSRIAMDLIDLARRHRLRVPDEYAILARTEVVLDGIARELVPDWDIMEGIAPYARRLASERLDPENIGGELLRSAVSVSAMLKDMPGQVDQILLDLERGNFQINAETPAVDRLTSTIDRVGGALIFGIGVSAFLLSASVLVAALVLDMSSDAGFGVVDLLLGFLVVGSTIAATGLLSALLWNLFVRERIKAVRWRRFAGLIPGLGRLRRRASGSKSEPD